MPKETQQRGLILVFSGQCVCVCDEFSNTRVNSGIKPGIFARVTGGSLSQN